MVRIKEIVIEAESPSQLARFWADTLTDFNVREYDDEEISRLASIGRTPDTDPTVAVGGPGMTVFFQETNRPKKERGRIHFDLVGGLRSGEVDRIVAQEPQSKARGMDSPSCKTPKATSSAFRTPATRDRRPTPRPACCASGRGDCCD